MHYSPPSTQPQVSGKTPSSLFGGLAFPLVIWRRLLSQPALMLTVWAGVVLAVAIVVSIPVYAESAGYRILLTALNEDQQSRTDNLSPFSMIYRYGGASTSAVTWSQYKQADDLASTLTKELGLPDTRNVRYAGTEKFRVMFADGQGKEVIFARLAFMSGLREQARIINGEWPRTWTGQGPIDVLIADTTATKNTILVDDLYRLQGNIGNQRFDLPIRIAGTWRAINPDNDYWYQTPSVLSDQLMVDEQIFTAIVNVPDSKMITYAAWYSAIDGSSVRSSSVSLLTDRIKTISSDLEQYLPGIELARSPIESLEKHREQVRLLTVTLSLFSVPLLALILYFVAQVTGFVIQRQQQEVAILRSRGSSRRQIMLMNLGEALILGLLAWLAGVPLGALLAQAIAWTQSFLHFAPLAGPQPELLPASWLHGLLAAMLVVPAALIPSYVTAGQTIISYKQDRARELQAPLWQRVFLDIMLLAPALYGYQQLKLNGMIAVPGVDQNAAAADPFHNPLLLLAPALLMFALGLLALRLFPKLLSLLAWLFAKLPGVSLVTALRFLSRTPRAYGGPVLLMMLTLSLATFTASMARTLDQHSQDRARYRAGTDARLASPGASIVTGGDMRDLPRALLTQGSSDGAAQDVALEASNDYYYIPNEDYLTIPGVQAASRVAASAVNLKIGQASAEDGLFYGVDRETLAAVINDSWRNDYADESLGALMNHLAESPGSALVSEKLFKERGLRIGDRISLEMSDLGARQDVIFTVAGALRYFPTLYPEDKPFIIGNLDYSYDMQSGQYDFEVWLKLKPGTNIATIEGASYGYGLRLIAATPERLLSIDTLRPERQGLFGLLSVGFLSTALVTIIGFLTYTLYSFQRRLVEMGVMRAIGLSSKQLAVLLISEQSLVIGVSTLLGTLFGMIASTMFLPFMQVRIGLFPDTPPFLVHIAWDQIILVYAIAALMLAITVVITLALLGRMRIFEAVKLGEAV